MVDTHIIQQSEGTDAATASAALVQRVCELSSSRWSVCVSYASMGIYC